MTIVESIKDNAKESDLKRILTLIEDDEEDIQV